MDLPLLLAYSLWGPVVCIIVLGVLIGCTLNTGQCGGDFFFWRQEKMNLWPDSVEMLGTAWCGM